METKKFIIEVEEGNTKCSECPLMLDGECVDVYEDVDFLQCGKYNLATMKITKMEEQQ